MCVCACVRSVPVASCLPPAAPLLLLCIWRVRYQQHTSWWSLPGDQVTFLPVGLHVQPLHPLRQQLLAALKLVDADVHVADGGRPVLAALAELHHLSKMRGGGVTAGVGVAVWRSHLLAVMQTDQGLLVSLQLQQRHAQRALIGADVTTESVELRKGQDRRAGQVAAAVCPQNLCCLLLRQPPED